jgi:superfamily II DNA/RNA helicase
MFYSATMAPEIERITNTFLTNPAKIEVARQATTSTTIEQKLITFTPDRKDRTFTEKRAVLRALIAPRARPAPTPSCSATARWTWTWWRSR